MRYLLRDRPISQFRDYVRRRNKFTRLRKAYSDTRFSFISHRIQGRDHSKLAIIGCGRSGTKFITKLFLSIGLKIGHERLEKHGIVSWTLTPDTDIQVWGPSYNQIRLLNIPVVHQVRDPLNVISSATKVFSDRKTWDFISKFIPLNEDDPVVLKAMKYWYYWNLLAEEKALYTYRVEQIEQEIDHLCMIGKFGISSPSKFLSLSLSKKVHSRIHPNLSWDDLNRVDKFLAKKIFDLAIRYGYNLHSAP